MSQPRLDSQTRKRLYNDLSVLRDGVFWYEDANGLDDTVEKGVLDKALNTLLDLDDTLGDIK